MGKSKPRRESRNASLLKGSLLREGFELWHHFFWGIDVESGEKLPFFIEFLRLNPYAGKKKKEGPTLSKQLYSFAMVRACLLAGPKSVVTAELYGEEAVSVSKRILSLRFGNNICLENSTRGSIVSDDKGPTNKFALAKAGSVSWELKMTKPFSYNLGYFTGKVARFLRLSNIYWDAAGLKNLVSGHITVNNREFRVESGGSFGYQDKTWGSRFPSEWFKLYGGKLSFTNNEEVKEAALVIMRANLTFSKHNLGIRYFINLTYNGKVYNFTSVFQDKNYFYSFNQKNEDNYLIIKLEAVKAKQKLVCNLKVKQSSLLALNYPIPQSTNLSYLMSGEAEAAIEIYQSDSLLDWELEGQFKLTGAAIQLSNLNNEQQTKSL